MIDNAFQDGIRHGSKRLGPSPTEVKSKPEFVRRANKLRTAPSAPHPMKAGNSKKLAIMAQANAEIQTKDKEDQKLKLLTKIATHQIADGFKDDSAGASAKRATSFSMEATEAVEAPAPDDSEDEAEPTSNNTSRSLILQGRLNEDETARLRKSYDEYVVQRKATSGTPSTSTSNATGNKSRSHAN